MELPNVVHNLLRIVVAHYLKGRQTTFKLHSDYFAVFSCLRSRTIFCAWITLLYQKYDFFEVRMVVMSKG